MSVIIQAWHSDDPDDWWQINNATYWRVVLALAVRYPEDMDLLSHLVGYGASGGLDFSYIHSRKLAERMADDLHTLAMEISEKRIPEPIRSLFSTEESEGANSEIGVLLAKKFKDLAEHLQQSELMGGSRKLRDRTEKR